jgi:hypothetical protein
MIAAVFALVFLMVFPSAAQAACLWVLWVPTSARQRGATADWSPDDTFETKTECRAGLERAVSKLLRASSAVQVDTP